MELYDAIYSRRTVRDFVDEEIDIELIKKIIDAGLQAPSNNHMREWQFIILNDKAARLEVIKSVNENCTEEDAIGTIDRWGLSDKFQREMYIDAIPKQYEMLLNAGCLIIPCFHQVNFLKPQNLSSLNGFASIWCCIENILLAAAGEGIYGVTRIPFDEEIIHIKKTANIPDDYGIPCYIALGYPEESSNKIIQHSVNVVERMHFNKW